MIHMVQLKDGSIDFVSDEELEALDEVFPLNMNEEPLMKEQPKKPIKYLVEYQSSHQAAVFYSEEALRNDLMERFPKSWPDTITVIDGDMAYEIKATLNLQRV